MMKRIIATRFGSIAAIVLLALGVSAEAKACPTFVASVCAVNKAMLLTTYNNICLARAAHAILLHKGICYGSAACPVNCAGGKAVYAKSLKTGKVTVYDNMCWAEKHFAVFLKYGKCP